MLELVPFREPPLDEFGLILGGGGGGGRGEPVEFPNFKTNIYEKTIFLPLMPIKEKSSLKIKA